MWCPKQFVARCKLILVWPSSGLAALLLLGLQLGSLLEVLGP